MRRGPSLALIPYDWRYYDRIFRPKDIPVLTTNGHAYETGGLFDLRPVTDGLDQIVARLERSIAGPSGYVMRRLLLVNYWHFDYEELVIPHGRLFLLGDNGSGKSTILGATLPLLLDGLVRPERLDTFGNNQRRIDYYVLGHNPTGGVEYQRRTSYVALEFAWHDQEVGAVDRTGGHPPFLTIGVCFAGRAGGDELVHPHRFVITSGKRLGIDIPLKSDDGKVYDAAYFRTIVKEHGVVAERQSDYRDLVARHLFGYEDPAVLDRLIDVLLLLRQPGLSNEIRTFDEVYNYLKRALPPLPAEVTKTTTEAFERIDGLRQMGYRLGRQAAAAQRIHEVDLDLARAKLRQRAWPVIVAERGVGRARADIQLARGDLERAERRFAEIQGEHERITQDHLAAESDVAELSASTRAQDLAAIELALTQAEEKVGFTRRLLEQHESGLAEAHQALTERRSSLETQRENWRRHGQSAEQHLTQLDRLAGLGRWPAAQSWVTRAFQALAATLGTGSSAERAIDELPLPAPENDLLPLIQERRQQVLALQQAHDGHERALLAESEAKRRHDDRRQAAAAADAALADARRGLASHWTALVAGLGRLAEGSAAGTFLSLDGLVAAAARQARAELTDALATLQKDTAEHTDRLARRVEQVSGELGQFGKQIDDLVRQLAVREAEADLTPARLPHRELARAALRDAGIDARPLYSLVDFAPDLALELQGPVERMLADAGLLDALVLRGSDDAAAAEVLGASGLADCRLDLSGSRPAATALGQVLAVEGTITDSAWRAIGERVLGSIGLAAIGGSQFAAMAWLRPDGVWRHGLLAGQAGTGGPLGFVGATRRAARRQREIDALHDELRQRRSNHDELVNRRGLLRRDLEGLQLAVRAVERAADLTDIVSGETRVHERERANADLKIQELAVASDLSEATRRRQELAGEIGEAMRILGASEPNRGLVASAERSLEGMASETRSLQNDVERLADIAIAMGQLHLEIARIDGRARLARGAVADARGEKDAADEALGRARQRLKDGDLEKFSGQLAVARDREARLRRALLAKSEEIGVRKTEVARERDSLIAVEARVVEAERGRSLAVLALDQLVQLNPDALAGAVPSEEAETIALAAILCPPETTEARAFDRQAEAARDSRRRVFDEERGELVDFDLSIAEDERDRVVVRIAQSPEGPLVILLETIQQRLRENDLLLNAEEERLFKDYLADTGLTAIHRSVQNADGLIARMNQILERTLLGRERYELRMEHRADRLDQLTPLARHHALFRKDPQAISDEERRVLFEAVRGTVTDARRRMDEGEGDFAELLAKAFDYREWFSLSMFVTDATGQRHRISSRMARTRSGAQQLFALYVPLFAALAALYESAATWAPHLFAMDEAFDKISEDNVTILLRFLVDLRFQWIVASPRLSGAGREVLPACADWQLYHNAIDKLAQAFPVLYSDGSIFDDPVQPGNG